LLLSSGNCSELYVYQHALAFEMARVHSTSRAEKLPQHPSILRIFAQNMI
jgi:hypothetical protein